MSIYFDHNATTPLHPAVFQAMRTYLEAEYGNASCLYRLGIQASYAVEKARRQVSRLIHCHEEEILFTSGGTESDNLALKGVILATGKKHLVTSAIEHPAILNPCRYLEQYADCHVTYLPVDRDGFVDPETVSRALRPDTALVSIMTANNETGSIQPIAEIASLCQKQGYCFIPMQSRRLDESPYMFKPEESISSRYPHINCTVPKERVLFSFGRECHSYH